MEAPSPDRCDCCLSRREVLYFELLFLIESQPGLSQRDIARQLGISLGRVNHYLKALLATGAIANSGLRGPPTQMRRAYVLAPSGLARRSAMATCVLKRKLAEIERLRAQIEALERLAERERR